jgi:tetratricopeptide (TPR) repeat protein
MRIKLLALIGLAAAGLTAGTAQASVVVLGEHAGATCYQSARAGLGSRSALETCTEALASGMLTAQEIVATHVNRGIVRLTGGDHKGALADFDRAIQLNPNEPESYLNKGSTLIRMGSAPAQAIPLFEEALQRKTRRPELAYFARGIAHELSGNVQAAYRDYKRAQELAPRWDEPTRELSRFQVLRAGETRM